MTTYSMPPESALALLGALEAHGVSACVGGGWAVDALVGRQTRDHGDLDLWLEAAGLEHLITAFVELGVDRLLPWGGDRPWNFVLHDGVSRRVDLHLYEDVAEGRLSYGSVASPFTFSIDDLGGQGEIDGMGVRCEAPEFALRNHTGYPPREVDHHDVALLCAAFGLATPADFR